VTAWGFSTRVPQNVRVPGALARIPPVASKIIKIMAEIMENTVLTGNNKVFGYFSHTNLFLT